MSLELHDDHALVRERALSEGLKEIATELRLVDVVDLISYVRTEQFANVEDLVESSAELIFKPGAMAFGWAADLQVSWDAPPAVLLDMEFRHKGLTVFFGLELRARNAAVSIHHISFDAPSEDPEENTRRLIDAIADARIAPPPLDGN